VTFAKSNRVVVVLDGEQAGKLQRLAKAQGLTMSAWLRAAVVTAAEPRQLSLPIAPLNAATDAAAALAEAEAHYRELDLAELRNSKRKRPKA
jgi:hypothetical protein